MIILTISLIFNVVLAIFLIIIIYMQKGLLDGSIWKNKSTMLGLFDIKKDDIVFLGDSITEGCQWHELFQDPRVKNRGIGGDDTKGILARLDAIILGKPEKIFICIGTNDFGRGTRPRNTVENTRKIISIIQEKSERTEIFLQSLFPVRGLFSSNLATNGRIVKINRAIQQVASEMDTTFIDLHGHFVDEKGCLDKKYTFDGLHLNGEGYKKWKGIIEPYMK